MAFYPEGGGGGDVTQANVSGVFTFTSGAAVTSSEYQIGRNNDSTDLLQLNTPGGGGFDFSVNGQTHFGVNANNMNYIQSTLTSSGTDDYAFRITGTLNDGTAPGGSDTYTGISLLLTATDTTGWDNVLLMDLQVDSKSVFQLDHINAALTLSDFGVGDFQIGVGGQNPASDDAGAMLSLVAGAAAGNTTGDNGGHLNLTGGAAAGSGNNNGGSITLTGGAATGSGQAGSVAIMQPGGTPGTDMMGLSHDGTDATYANLDSSGGHKFVDNTFTEVAFFDGSEVAFAGTLLNPTLTNGNETTQTLTDGANISWDLDSGGAATVTLAGNRTLDNPTNMKNGATYYVIVKQDATGTRTLAYGSAYKWPGGTAPTLSTTGNDIDILTFISDGTSLFGVGQLDFS